jgi:hypothetical protein
LHLVQRLSEILKAMREDDFRKLWAFSIHKWVATMRYEFV